MKATKTKRGVGGSTKLRANRLLGFSGTPTDEEIDEVISLWARVLLRLLTSSEFVHVMRNARQFGAAFERAFGDC